jgi:hypothetical protein
MIVSASATQVPRVALGLHIIVPHVVLTTHLGFRLSAWMGQPIVGQKSCQRGGYSYLRGFLGCPLPPLTLEQSRVNTEGSI